MAKIFQSKAKQNDLSHKQKLTLNTKQSELFLKKNTVTLTRLRDEVTEAQLELMFTSAKQNKSTDYKTRIKINQKAKQNKSSFRSKIYV